MGLRFRKRVKIAPGVSVNLGLRSIGISAGPRGSKVSVSTSGRKSATFGIPGTGLSFSQSLNIKKGKKTKPNSKKETANMEREMLLEQVENALKQARETADLINKTTNPETFFGRLHFLFDLFLYLSKFEDYGIFREMTPTEQFQKIHDNLEATVNDFIDRSFAEALEKASALKTEKGQRNALIRYSEKVLSAFESCETYWQGNGLYPHYSGNLYEQENILAAEELAERIKTDPLETLFS